MEESEILGDFNPSSLVVEQLEKQHSELGSEFLGHLRQVTNLLILILQQKQNLHPELKQFMAVKRVMAWEKLKLEKHLQKM